MRIAVAGAGAMSVCAGIAIVVNLGTFFLHSSSAGGALVGQEKQAIAKAAASPSACQAPPSAAGGAGKSSAQAPSGLLEVPSLGMVAPVVQGTGDPVLAEAVGHDPASVWPGGAGTSVLSAHDVTWFSSVGKLKAGDEISYVTPCLTYTYRVTSHQIVKAGSPVYTTSASRLVLDTCWPLDALYITPTRYLVYASLSRTAPTHAPALPAAVAAPPAWQPPKVPAPAALSAQGLSLDRNPAQLGTLHLAGSPARAWAQSSAPLDFQTAALAEYFAILRSAAQQQRAWWADLAPGTPVSAAGALWGGQVDSYRTSLSVTLRAAGTAAVSATLSATVTIHGPGGTGSYHISVTETVKDDTLYVTQLKLSAA